MLGLLAQDGILPVAWDPSRDGDNTTPADAVVVNTCGFLEASKHESLAVIADAVRAKQRGHVKRVVVAGCLVQRHRARMLEWHPGIDAMVGVFDRDHIVEAVRGAAPARPDLANASDRPTYWVHANALTKARHEGLPTVGLTVNGTDGRGVGYFEDDSARLRLTPRHYAYLRLSEGCNQNCAFCTIPSIRGKMRSKPLERILAEARELLLDGAFELSLIGQDTTSYGDDIGTGYTPPPPRAKGPAAGAPGNTDSPTSHRASDLSVHAHPHTRNQPAELPPGPGSRLPDADPLFSQGGLPTLLNALSDAIADTTGAGWLRLMYAYPSNFRDEFIDAFARLCAQGHLVPYIDIPLQHASDPMLNAMRRNVTADHQRTLMHKLRDRIPGIAIRTTFIAGFPGETEDDHRRLLDFIEEIRFDAVGVFEYSPEPGTRAYTMERDPSLAVDPETKARRREELMLAQQRIAFDRAARLAAPFDPARPEDTGERFDILIDARAHVEGEPTSGAGEGGALYVGRSYFQAPQVDAITFVHSRAPLAPGELVRCTITGSNDYDLIATPTHDLHRRIPLPLA